MNTLSNTDSRKNLFQSQGLSHFANKVGNEDENVKEKDKKPKNDIRDIRSYKQLDKVELDLDSPRFS